MISSRVISAFGSERSSEQYFFTHFPFGFIAPPESPQRKLHSALCLRGQEGAFLRICGACLIRHHDHTGQEGQGAAVSRGVPGSVGSRGPPLDREAAITAAVERMNKNPAERESIYQKARNRILAIMRANKLAIAEREFKEGLTKNHA
jgi:hypothetical protein